LIRTGHRSVQEQEYGFRKSTIEKGPKFPSDSKESKANEREDVTEGCKQLHIEKFRNLWSNLYENTVRKFKSRKVGLLEHVARTLEVRKGYIILVEKSEGKRLLLEKKITPR
jgi:hypothetical protein